MAAIPPHPRPVALARRTAWGVLGCAAAAAGASAWRAAGEHRTPAVARAAERLPSAPAPARLYSAPAQAAPAAGVTSTTALPPLPAAALADPVPAAAAAAPRPFAWGPAGALDRARAAQCLTAAIYYEAGSEPEEGQRAVAQVVLNRVRHPAFPGTVCGVVYQGSDGAGCQFSFACDGAEARAPSRDGWARAARVAAGALAGGLYAPVGWATHYHTYAVRPAWNRAMVMTDAVGAHFFHRWRGWWGTAAAFSRPYAGREPDPHPVFPPAPAAPPIAAAPPLPPAPVAQAAAPPAPRAAEPDRLPPAPAVLDRWRDSGQPIR